MSFDWQGKGRQMRQHLRGLKREFFTLDARIKRIQGKIEITKLKKKKKHKNIKKTSLAKTTMIFG